MRNFFCLLLVCLFALPTIAESESQNIPLSESDTNVFEFTSGVQGPLSVSVYMEEGRWVVELRAIAADGLPDLISEKKFRSKQQAWEYAKSLGVTLSNEVPEALDVPAPEVLNLPGLTPPAVLWKATTTWNWAWEVKFAAWMRENLNPKFFEDLKIENDCADAYYQARMIFARIHKLPVSFRLASTGAWFTNNTLRADWKTLKTNNWTLENWSTQLKKDARFLKVLDYVADNTYTHTLGRDTYPIALSKEGLIEGTAYLTLSGTSGHTLLVNEINLNNSDKSNKARLPMYTLNSTVPKGVQPLTESFFFSSTQPEIVKNGKTGFVRFRWPIAAGATELVEMSEMPHYSEEQYNPELLQSNPDLAEDDPARTNFSLFVFKRLNPDFDPVLRITEGIDLLADLLSQRDGIVTNGYAACKAGCDPLGPVYDNWSTPSRDGRIKELINDLESYRSYLSEIVTVQIAWDKALASDIIKLEGTAYPLSIVKWVWQNDLFSTDPNQTPGIRWGLNPEAFAQGSYNAIAPDILARKNKIDTVPDCKNCPLFSKDFILSSTFIEDQNINEAVSLRAQYCENAGPELCKRFEAAIATFPPIVPEQSSFLETWQNIAMLNSDPRVSKEARWGKITTVSDTLKLDGPWSAINEATKDSLVAFVKNVYPNTELSVVDTVSKKQLFAKSFTTYIAWTMDIESSQIAGRLDEPKQVIFINPITGEELQRLSYPLADSDYVQDFKWLSPDLVSLQTAFTLVIFKRQESGLFAPAQVLEDRYTSINKTLMASADLEKLVVLDLLTGQSTTISVKGLFPAQVQKNELTVERAGDTAVLINWYHYDETPGKSTDGRVFINLQEQSVKVVNQKIFPNRILDGFTFLENDSRTVTTLMFVDDNLNILSQIKLDGTCSACYWVDRYFQVGQKVIAVDKKAKTLTTVAELPAGVTLSSVFDNMMSLSYSDDDTNEYSNSIVSLKDGKVLAVAPSVNFSVTDNNSFYPFITTSYYVGKTIGEGTPEAQYLSYNFYATLDPLNLGAGAITTTAGYQSDGECGEGGCHGEEGDGLAGLLPVKSGFTDNDFNILLTPPKVTIVGPGINATATQRPLRLINVSDKFTLVIFQ